MDRWTTKKEVFGIHSVRRSSFSWPTKSSFLARSTLGIMGNRRVLESTTIFRKNDHPSPSPWLILLSKERLLWISFFSSPSHFLPPSLCIVSPCEWGGGGGGGVWWCMVERGEGVRGRFHQRRRFPFSPRTDIIAMFESPSSSSSGRGGDLRHEPLPPLLFSYTRKGPSSSSSSSATSREWREGGGTVALEERGRDKNTHGLGGGHTWKKGIRGGHCSRDSPLLIFQREERTHFALPNTKKEGRESLLNL